MIRTLVVLAALLASGSASAAESAIRGTGAYGTAGCGLGSMIFGNQAGPVQILAATTNGILGSQTFGITSGTSNCGPGLIAQGTRNFVEANREALAKDMSRGQGETIGALSFMAGCASPADVGAALQSSYGTIIPSERASADEIAEKLLETLKANPALGCKIG